MSIKKFLVSALCAVSAIGTLHADWPFRDHRYSSLKATPSDNIDVMFVGNSITNMHEWWEAFGSDQAIAGRGNSGGVSQEILDNLESYIDGKPKKLFLMIGTNDIGRAGSTATAELTARKIRAILMRIQLESPETEIFMQSILPRQGMNGAIAHANEKIKEYCTELGVQYIDLTEVLKEIPNNTLWSNDGLHPQTKGYAAWTHYIEDQVGRKSVYPMPEEITSYKGVATQSNASRTAQFPFLPINEGDILIFGDDLVHGGEWHELLGSPKAKDRGTNWGTGGITLVQGKDAIKNTLEGRTTQPGAIIINYGEGGKDANNYRLIIDQAKSLAPDAKIFCMSLPPRATANDADNTNKNFNDNTIKVAAQEKGVGYIDIYTPLAANRNKYIMQGSYISGPGYAVIANEIAKALNDPDLNPVTLEDTDKLIQRRNNRAIVGNKITEAILFNEDFDDPELSAELSAAIETAAKSITNTMTTAQANTAANKLDAVMFKIAGALLPASSNDQETHWYIIRSVRGNRAAIADGENVLGVQDEINPNFTFGHNIWKLLEREDGDTYDIINMRGEYVSAEGVANNSGLKAVTSQPAGGWDLRPSSHTPGSFVIFSDAMNNAQWNQSGNDDFPVLNWHPANNYPILTDEGSSYTFEEFFGEMVDPLSTGWYRINLETLDGLPEGHGTHVLNADAERRQNATNFYPLMYGNESADKPAKEYVHLTVNGSVHRFSSINGHGVKENCTSSRTTIADDGPAVSMNSDGTYALGKWHTWVVNGVAYVGRSGSSNNSFTLTRVPDEELDQYDIWTVSLTSAPHSEVGKDVSVSLHNSANKGIETVFNGGKYFLPSGTEVNADQLTFTIQNTQILDEPFVHVDPETKTIQIDFNKEHTIPVSSVELDREILTLEVGQTQHLIATVNPADATDQAVNWASSNPAIASVDAEGLVSALSVGDATITASCGGESAQCVVTVNEATIAISEISSGDTPKAIFDLQGRKVINPVKGLYIENNKLILK